VDLLAKHLPPDIERWIACPDEEPYASAWRSSPAVRDVLSIPRRRFSLGTLFELARVCRQWDIEIVHSHGKGAGVYSRLLKLLRPRLKVIHTVHGVHIGQYGPVVRIIYLMTERLLRRLTTAFVHVSNGEQARCLKLGISAASRSHVVYNGLPPVQTSEKRQPPELANVSSPIILTLARFEHQKNMPLALEIAALAQRDHPEWSFVWAGDGPERAGLERQAQERGLTNIRFLGFTHRATDLIRDADVVLSTSLWEGLPYALIEACALGVPIVASDVVGNDEVVIPNRNGFLYPLEDPGMAVTMIREILADPGLRARLSQDAAEVYRESFTLDKSVSRIASLYRVVASKS
jgi:glycosyltransferase involved in cell wall biosynthesis